VEDHPIWHTKTTWALC